MTLVVLLLVVGLFLWQQYSLVETEISYPITFENLSRGLTVSGQPPKEVDVVVKGQKIALEALRAQKDSFALNLSGAEAGLVTLPIEGADLHLPENISIVHLEPSSVTLRIEAKRTKTVPVGVILSDDAPAAGYAVEFTQSTPASLRISGPEKIITPIEQLDTLPVSIKDAAESFKKEVAVDLPEEVTIEGGGTPVVTAQITIMENVGTRRFENVPIDGRNTLLPIKITPETMSIDVGGPENVLSTLSVDTDITAYVDLKDLSPGAYVRPIQITLPVGTTLDGAAPEVSTVVIGQ
jgi:YbbR domain-containing protein